MVTAWIRRWLTARSDGDGGDRPASLSDGDRRSAADFSAQPARPAASAATDDESGTETREPSPERDRRALEVMRARGLISEAEYTRKIERLKG